MDGRGQLVLMILEAAQRGGVEARYTRPRFNELGPSYGTHGKLDAQGCQSRDKAIYRNRQHKWYQAS